MKAVHDSTEHAITMFELYEDNDVYRGKLHVQSLSEYSVARSIPSLPIVCRNPQRDRDYLR